jgi:hypothetical protein
MENGIIQLDDGILDFLIALIEEINHSSPRNNACAKQGRATPRPDNGRSTSTIASLNTRSPTRQLTSPNNRPGIRPTASSAYSCKRWDMRLIIGVCMKIQNNAMEDV